MQFYIFVIIFNLSLSLDTFVTSNQILPTISNDIRFEDCEKLPVNILTPVPPEADAKYDYFYARISPDELNRSLREAMSFRFMPKRARNFCRYCVDGFVVTDDQATNLFLPTYYGLYREPNASRWTWAGNGSSVANITQYHRFRKLDADYYDSPAFRDESLIGAYAYQTDMGNVWDERGGIWPTINYVVCQSPSRSKKSSHEWTAFLEENENCQRVDNETCGKLFTKFHRSCQNDSTCQLVRNPDYGKTLTEKCNPEQCGMTVATSNNCRRKIIATASGTVFNLFLFLALFFYS